MIGNRPGELAGDQPFGGGGSGFERTGGASATARNSSGGSFQSKGASGSAVAQGANMLSPSRLRISKTIPGRAISTQRSHSLMAIHSLIAIATVLEQRELGRERAEEVRQA